MNNLTELNIKIPAVSEQLELEAQEHLDDLTKPRGSLGKLEWLAKKIVGMTNSLTPQLVSKVIFTMAGDHGIAASGVSAYPQEVTVQMVHNFLNAGAAINVLANHVAARVDVVDMGVAGDISSDNQNFINKKIAYGTKNFSQGPAMSYEQALGSIEAGREVFALRKNLGIDILGVGDMGIGNTSASSALVATFTGVPLEEVVGRGTGVDEIALQNKITIIKKGLEINRPNKKDPIDVLAKVGGFEIGGIAGAILAAAADRVPVVIDGFIATAAALIAEELVPDVHPYLIASHKSQEKGHQAALRYMNLEPILDLDLRLGEGTGAALAMHIIEASIRIFNEMATFSSAGVSEKDIQI